MYDKYLQDGVDDDDDPAEEIGKEAKEHDSKKKKKKSDYKSKSEKGESDSLLPDLDYKESTINVDNLTDTANLLAELGLADIENSSLLGNFPSSQSDFGISTNAEGAMFDIDLSAKLPRSNTMNDQQLQDDDLFGPFFNQALNVTNESLSTTNKQNTNLLSDFN